MDRWVPGLLRTVHGSRAKEAGGVCGRYTLRTPVDIFSEEFGITGPLPEVPGWYNVAPTQEVATVLAEDDERHLDMLRWGLIPP